MPSCLGPLNRLRSRVSPNTATPGVTLFRIDLNVEEAVLGVPLAGSDSSIISTERGNGAAAAVVDCAIIASKKMIRRASIFVHEADDSWEKPLHATPLGPTGADIQ